MTNDPKTQPQVPRLSSIDAFRGLVMFLMMAAAFLAALTIASAADGSGVAFCLDAATLRVIWKVATRGGERNCNNISSPALAGGYLH